MHETILRDESPTLTDSTTHGVRRRTGGVPDCRERCQRRAEVAGRRRVHGQLDKRRMQGAAHDRPGADLVQKSSALCSRAVSVTLQPNAAC